MNLVQRTLSKHGHTNENNKPAWRKQKKSLSSETFGKGEWWADRLPPPPTIEQHTKIFLTHCERGSRELSFLVDSYPPPP